MKKLIFLLLFFYQVNSQQKFLLEASYFGGIKPTDFSIVPTSLLYKATKNIGIGLSYVAVRGGSGTEKETHFGPRVEYSFGQLKARPFVGVTLSKSTFDKANEQQKAWEAKYAFGARYLINKNVFLKAEASNYRFDSGFSIWPSLGLGIAL